MDFYYLSNTDLWLHVQGQPAIRILYYSKSSQISNIFINKDENKFNCKNIRI